MMKSFNSYDIVKIGKIKRRIRWKSDSKNNYFKGKIGIIEYSRKNKRHPKMYIVGFYFGRGSSSKRIITEVFHVDELEKPSEPEMKKFQLFLDEINAREIAEKL